MNFLKQSNINIMYSALYLFDELLEIDEEDVSFSKDIKMSIEDKKQHTKKLIQTLDDFCDNPNDNLALYEEDILFIIEALNFLIKYNEDNIHTEKKSKAIKHLKDEVQASRACISLLNLILNKDAENA